VAEYLGWFEQQGYRAALLEKGSTQERPYASISALLADIGDTDELHDVILVPTADERRAAGRDATYPSRASSSASTSDLTTSRSTWRALTNPWTTAWSKKPSRPS